MRVSTHFSQVKPVVDFVPEWAHLYFTNELRLDLGISKYRWKQLAQVWKEQIHLVMDRGIQCGQCQTVIAKVRVAQHAGQDGYHQRS